MMTDPIADMLTRIRNAHKAEMVSLAMPSSAMKLSIAAVLKEEGYIDDFSSSAAGPMSELTISLKYYEGEPVIAELKRISRPGLRVYKSAENLPRIREGLGVAIVSTNKGIMTDRAARAAGIGGEVLCSVC